MDKSANLPPVIVSPVFVNGTAVMRALSRRGAHCVAVSSREGVAGFATRYAREKVFLPEMETTKGVFADWLLERRDLYGALVIPTGDEIVAEVNAERDRLSEHYRLCIPDESTCRIALDKAMLLSAADDAGVVNPLTIQHPADADDWESRGVGFPAIVKPCYCIDFSRAFGRKIAIVNNRDELNATLERCRRLDLAVVVQEYVSPDAPVASYNGYVRRDGTVAGDFTSLRPGMFPPATGTGFLETTAEIPEVLDAGRRLLSTLGYSGALVNMDFKLCTRENSWKLLDLNVRSWRQVALAPLAGVDVLEHLLRDYTDRPPLSNGPAKSGKYWFYLKDALLMYRAFPKEAPPLSEYIRALLSGGCFGLLDLRDLRPFVEDIKPLFLRRVHKVFPRHVDQ